MEYWTYCFRRMFHSSRIRIYILSHKKTKLINSDLKVMSKWEKGCYSSSTMLLRF